MSTCPTVHLDGVRYVSECIRTVQCAGDCSVERCRVPAEVWGDEKNAVTIHENVFDGLEPENQESVAPGISNNFLEPHRGRVDGTNMHKTLEKGGDKIIASNEANIGCVNIIKQNLTSIDICNTQAKCDGDIETNIIILANPNAAMEGNVLPDFDVWMKEMMRDAQTERTQDDGHLHQVQVFYFYSPPAVFKLQRTFLLSDHSVPI